HTHPDQMGDDVVEVLLDVVLGSVGDANSQGVRGHALETGVEWRYDAEARAARGRDQSTGRMALGSTRWTGVIVGNGDRRTDVRQATTGQVKPRRRPMLRPATLRPLTGDELSQLHTALAARIDALEQASGEDPDAVGPELLPMLRKLNQDVVEARRRIA